MKSVLLGLAYLVTVPAAWVAIFTMVPEIGRMVRALLGSP